MKRAGKVSPHDMPSGDRHVDPGIARRLCEDERLAAITACDRVGDESHHLIGGVKEESRRQLRAHCQHDVLLTKCPSVDTHRGGELVDRAGARVEFTAREKNRRLVPVVVSARNLKVVVEELRPDALGERAGEVGRHAENLGSERQRRLKTYSGAC